MHFHSHSVLSYHLQTVSNVVYKKLPELSFREEIRGATELDLVTINLFVAEEQLNSRSFMIVIATVIVAVLIQELPMNYCLLIQNILICG